MHSIIILLVMLFIEELKKLEAENKELLLNKARLEASLEESLLGKLSDKKEKKTAENHNGGGRE